MSQKNSSLYGTLLAASGVWEELGENPPLPEYDLWFAVIIEAMNDYHSPIQSHRRSARRFFNDTWTLRGQTPCAVVCGLLSHEPEVMVAGIKRLLQSNAADRVKRLRKRRPGLLSDE